MNFLGILCVTLAVKSLLAVVHRPLLELNVAVSIAERLFKLTYSRHLGL